MKKLFPVLAVCLALLLEASVCSRASGYIPHVLCVSGLSFGRDINDHGQIVGCIEVAGGSRAVLWNSYDSAPQWLDRENRRPTARLINNAGLVVGEHEGLPGVINPFLWDAAHGVTDCGGASFGPEALNESGTVVGSTSGSNGCNVPVVMDSTGRLTCLEVVAGYDGGYARDINDTGCIVGVSFTPSAGGRACMWQAGEPVVSIGAFSGKWSEAIAINNAGLVVGCYKNDNGQVGSFLWSQQGGTTFLPAAPLLDDGCPFVPIDINDSGVVLGGGTINGAHVAITWSQTESFTIVGEGDAYAINNAGYIVGTLNESYGSNRFQAIVWEPVPEPSSLLALAGGLGCLAALRGNKRRRTA